MSEHTASISYPPSYESTGEHHPYHLVRPSIWPLAGALAGGVFALGMILFMHDVAWGNVKFGLWGPLLGVAAILAVMGFWWKDVIAESIHEHVHNKITERGLKLGMALFIISEIMFFSAFFGAFFDLSIFVDDVKQYLRHDYAMGVWPPPFIHPVDPFDLPFLMTMILVLSGTTVTWAHHAILHGRKNAATTALSLTVLLGLVFVGLQAFEYTHAHFKFGDGSFASTFYMATGFHGFHVIVGTIFLGVCLIRNMKGHFLPHRHFGFEAAAWYWHFVDIVWIFLFFAVYVWGGMVGVGDHESARAALEAQAASAGE